MFPFVFVIDFIPLTVVLQALKPEIRLEKEKRHQVICYLWMIFNFTAVVKMTLVVFWDQENLYLGSDIGIKFGMDKCIMLKIKREKQLQFEGTDLEEGMVKEQVNQEGHKYLGILERWDVC